MADSMRPLATVLDVVKGIRIRLSFHEVYRHQVMHGESVDYDTEENSLKAVSLLSWLAVVLNYEPEGEQGSGADSLP